MWRIKSDEYRDRNMKNQAYSYLLNKIREVVEEATIIQTVKNKINSMCGSFRKELKKIKDSQKSSAGEEDVYKHSAICTKINHDKFIISVSYCH